jgi:neutral amino acid transport system substrate-binding protein
VQEGAKTANVLVGSGDYNSSLASDFGAQFGQLGGRTLPSVTTDANATSYVGAISQVFSYKADRTLLLASPTAASTMITEWVIGGRRGYWYLSPMLKADVLLLNIPFGALDDYFGLSPSMSLASECSGIDSDAQGYVGCSRANAAAYGEHFASRWDHDRPFLASQFYYDAVVLLAMGLQYGLAVDGELPNTLKLQKYIRRMGSGAERQVSWQNLTSVMSQLADGSPIGLAGAAAEYTFDEYGTAKHVVFDTWTADGQSFQDTGTFFADCPKNR